MRIKEESIEDLMRAVSRSRPCKRLRDKALLLLMRHPQVTVEMLASITAADVSQDAAGGIRFRLVADGGLRVVYAGTDATRVLLEYMETNRLWGSDRSLFGLSPRGIRSALRRLMARVSCRAREREE